MKFSLPLRVPIANHLSGRTYQLVRACDLRADSSTVAWIVSICSEPNVYEWLFREPLDGLPYDASKALEWLRWSNDGWQLGTHFVFAVIDDQESIAAACDIKSNEQVAEIGYWASDHHRGVMTNAIVAMCTLAAEEGFRGLLARTKKENHRSQRVLQRAGFTRIEHEDSSEERFMLPLKREEQRPNQALQPTPMSVTPRADARGAPSNGVADL